MGRYIFSYMEKGIQTPKAQGRSAEIIFIKLIRTSRLSIQNSLSLGRRGVGACLRAPQGSRGQRPCRWAPLCLPWA